MRHVKQGARILQRVFVWARVRGMNMNMTWLIEKVVMGGMWSWSQRNVMNEETVTCCRVFFLFFFGCGVCSPPCGRWCALHLECEAFLCLSADTGEGSLHAHTITDLTWCFFFYPGDQAGVGQAQFLMSRGLMCSPKTLHNTKAFFCPSWKTLYFKWHFSNLSHQPSVHYRDSCQPNHKSKCSPSTFLQNHWWVWTECCNLTTCQHLTLLLWWSLRSRTTQLGTGEKRSGFGRKQVFWSPW